MLSHIVHQDKDNSRSAGSRCIVSAWDKTVGRFGLGRLKLNVCFASGYFGNRMRTRKNTTQVPEIYTCLCGQK